MRFLLLALLATSCVSAADMRAQEGQLRDLAARITATADDVGDLATDLEKAETSGSGKWEALGARLGQLGDQLSQTARVAETAATTAGKAAENAERLESTIPGKDGSPITGNPLVDALVGMVVTGAGTFMAVNKARDRKYVHAAPLSTAPPGKVQQG